MKQTNFSATTGWVIQPDSQQTAIAIIKGGPLAPQIRGSVILQTLPDGTWITADITGLPPYQPAQPGRAPIGPHGFHIHQFADCRVGDPANPFQAAGGHWNPDHQPHGNHAGDLPVLFSIGGKALLGFYTNRFSVAEAIGHTVIIHQNPDDYRSQPAGNAGKRLACGIIKPYVKTI
jgi:Cu-Zn family superoxide dismutase